MGSFSSYTQYYNALVDKNKLSFFNYDNPTPVGNRLRDVFYYQSFPNPNGAPAPSGTAATQFNKSSIGAINIPYVISGGTLKIIGVEEGGQQITSTSFILDRLVTVGGITGSSATTQVIDTGTLPRYTAGTGVLAYLHTSANATIATNGLSFNTGYTISYTNQDGVSGKTGTFTMGNSNQTVARIVIPVNLDVGDTGIRSVQSITFTTTATTTTGATLALTLAKPLYMYTVPQYAFSSDGNFNNIINGFSVGGIPEIDSNACLYMFKSYLTISGFASGWATGNIYIKEV